MVPKSAGPAALASPGSLTPIEVESVFLTKSPGDLSKLNLKSGVIV